MILQIRMSLLYKIPTKPQYQTQLHHCQNILYEALLADFPKDFQSFAKEFGLGRTLHIQSLKNRNSDITKSQHFYFQCTLPNKGDSKKDYEKLIALFRKLVIMLKSLETKINSNMFGLWSDKDIYKEYVAPINKTKKNIKSLVKKMTKGKAKLDLEFDDLIPHDFYKLENKIFKKSN